MSATMSAAAIDCPSLRLALHWTPDPRYGLAGASAPFQACGALRLHGKWRPALQAVRPCVRRVCLGAPIRLACAGPPKCHLRGAQSLPMPLLQRVFYGWYVVAAVLVTTTAFSGLIFYNLSILLAAFVAERGFPVALASSATATFFLAAGIGGVVAGRLVDRFDARVVIGSGATLGALCLASAGALQETWQLFLFHVIFGLAHGTCGLVPVTTVIARWFNVHRSLAFSIGSTG